MSFILDALKKSEAERQRQVGPTLLEVRVTHPRRRLPTWVMIVGGLLLANLAVLGIVLHRPSSPSSSGAATGIAAPSVVPSAAPSLAPTAARAGGTATGVASPAPPSNEVAALADAGGGAADQAAGSAGSPAMAEGTHNPADDEPAVAARRDMTRGMASSASVGVTNLADLPSAAEVGGNVTNLRLDLLVYADRAGDRYALVNMRRVREGDVLPEGARVIAITRDGVALNYRGQEFMLHPQ